MDDPADLLGGRVEARPDVVDPALGEVRAPAVADKLSDLLPNQPELERDRGERLDRAVVEIEAGAKQPSLARLGEQSFALEAAVEKRLSLDDGGQRAGGRPQERDPIRRESRLARDDEDALARSPEQERQPDRPGRLDDVLRLRRPVRDRSLTLGRAAERDGAEEPPVRV